RPRDDASAAVDPALDADHAAGAEVGPGEFLIPRPHQLHGLPHALGDPPGFNRCPTAVVAAVPRSHVGPAHARPVPRHLAGWRHDAEEITVADDRHAAHRAGTRVVDRLERRADGVRTHDAAVDQPGTLEVRRVFVAAGDERAAVDLLHRRAAHVPRLRIVER